VDAIGLVNIVQQLNRGLVFGGNQLAPEPALPSALGANHGVPNMREIRRLSTKSKQAVRRNAAVFDLSLVENFLSRIAPLPHPGDRGHGLW